MFHIQLHLKSGSRIDAELDPPLIDRLVSDLVALPGVVPRLLIRLPSEDELADRAGRLRLVAIALGEMLGENGTLDFLAQHARAVIVDRESVAAIEVIDPDPATSSRRQGHAESHRDIAVPAG